MPGAASTSPIPTTVDADAALQLGGLRQLLQGAPSARAARARVRDGRRVSVVDRSDRSGASGRVSTPGFASRRSCSTTAGRSGSRTRSSGICGDGTQYVPDDAYERAQTLQWMFFEQYSHEPHIAVARFWIAYSGSPEKFVGDRRERAHEGRICGARRDGEPSRRAGVPRRRVGTRSRTSRSTRTRTSRTRASSISRRIRRSARGSIASALSRVTSRSTPEPCVRVRFAPSPTGSLHLGNALTAVANRSFADERGGVLVLRIDDTDPTRTVEGGEDAILQDLDWLGIDFDEGPVRQSRRWDLYAKAAERAVAAGAAERDEEDAVRLRSGGATLLRRRRHRHVPTRLGRRRPRAGDHPRAPWIRSPPEPRAAAAHRACRRRGAAGGDPSRAHPRSRTGRSSPRGMVMPRSQICARVASRRRVCVHISTSSAFPRMTSSSISLGFGVSRSTRSRP